MIIKQKNEAGSISPQRKGRCRRKSKTTFKDGVFQLSKAKEILARLLLIFGRILLL
jgi:hypothetical protein